MVTYAMIAAISKNNVIANNGRIPWDIPEDMEHYKSTVKDQVIVCGRKTYELAINNPYRDAVVISSKEDYDTGRKNAHLANSIEDAMDLAEKLTDSDDETIYIAGGESVYDSFLDTADRLVISHIPNEYEGDRFFPEFDRAEWEVKDVEQYDDFKVKTYCRL